MNPWSHAGLGVEFVGIFLAFVFLGNFLDKKFQTNYCILIGLCLGLGFGLYHILLRTRKTNDEPPQK